MSSVFEEKQKYLTKSTQCVLNHTLNWPLIIVFKYSIAIENLGSLKKKKESRDKLFHKKNA